MSSEAYKYSAPATTVKLNKRDSTPSCCSGLSKFMSLYWKTVKSH